MNYPRLRIGLSLWLTLVGAAVTFASPQQNGANPSKHTEGAGSTVNPVLPAASLPDRIGTASSVFGKLPAGPTLAIKTKSGDVVVHNFYSANTPVNEAQDLVIKITKKYLIVYDPSDMSFWLGIKGKPFEAWQHAAEVDLLKTLAISEAEACRLTATSGVIYSPGDPNNGKSFPLTLCGTRAPRP